MLDIQIYVPVYREQYFSVLRRRLVDTLEFGLGYRAQVKVAPGSARVMVAHKNANSRRLVDATEQYFRRAVAEQKPSDIRLGEIIHCAWNILDADRGTSK